MKFLIASTIPLCIINLFSSIGQMRFFCFSLAYSASVLQAKSGNCITQSIYTERYGCCCCCQSIHHQSEYENRMMEKKYRKLNRIDSRRTMERQMHELLFSFIFFFSSRNLRIAIFCCRSVAVVDYSIVSGLAFVASFDFLNCQTVK